MSFFFALFLWLVMAATLVTGVVLAVHDNFWLLGVGLFLFVAGVTKQAILHH
jgi:hypothetical protein